MTLRFILAILCSFCLAGSHAQRHGAEKICRKVSDAVVGIYAYNDIKNPIGRGSGVIIKDKGWIVTNSHILE